jgi:hypothetical protein
MSPSKEVPSNLVFRLRIITILTFIPALAFNIPHGLIFHTALPAVGLVPQAVGVVLAIYDLDLLNKLFGNQEYHLLLEDGSGEYKRTGVQKVVVAILDFLISLGLIACVTGGFIIMLDENGNWHRGINVPSGSIMGAFSTIPFLTNA